jgi:ribonuclease D
MICTAKAALALAEQLAREPMIGLDTEFIRETTFFPKIALLQVSTADRTWLIDPLAVSKQDMAPVLEIFRDKKILKIVHAAFADQECLYWSYGIVAEPVLDTAVAAALLGLGDSIGLGALLKDVLKVQVPKGRARVKWLERPLPRELVQYAEQDVAHLVPLAKRLLDELARRGRVDWALAESVVPVSALDVPPEEMAMRVARGGQWERVALGRLVALFRWRERRAKLANLPRPWVASNEVLVSLARVAPRSLEQLRVFRGLNAKEVERQGNAILAAIRDGEQHPVDPPPAPERGGRLRDSEELVLELVRAYVTYLAAKHEVVPRLLLSAPQAVALLRAVRKDPRGWVEAGVMSPEAARLIGDDLSALLSGHRALGVRGGKLAIFPVDGHDGPTTE